MTALRQRRVWSTQDSTKIVCDGPRPEPCRESTPVEGRDAAEARQRARQLGWRVAVKDRRSRVRQDYCPAHREEQP